MVYEGDFKVTHVLADGTKLTSEQMRKHLISDKSVIRVVAHAIKHYEDVQSDLKAEANGRQEK